MKHTELLKGTLSTIIMKLLDEHGRMYGYEITQKVKDITDSNILIKEGSLYPALHKLLNEDLVDVEKESIGKRIRKYYQITEEGRRVKDEQLNELKTFIDDLQKLIFNETII